MNVYLQRLKASTFIKGVIALSTGTTIAQIVPVLLTPILTRLYSPESFGLFTLYNSLFGMFVLYAAGRYEQAIMLPKKHEDAYNILGLTFGILTIVVVVSEAAVIGLEGWWSSYFEESPITRWLPWVPLSVFFLGGYQIFFMWFNRQRAIQLLTISKIITVFFLVSVQLMMGMQGVASGLIYGLIAGQAAGLTYLAYHFFRNKNSELKLNWAQMKANAKKYKDFPLVNSFQSLIDTIHQHGVILVINTFYPAAVLGNIGMAKRAVGSPAALIGRSFSHNIYERTAHYKNQNIPLTPFLKKILITLAIIAVPAFGGLFFFAEDIFPWLLGGEKWGQAGRFVQLLIPYLLFNFFSSPLAVVPFVMNQQAFFLKLSSVGNLVAIGLFTFLSYSGASIDTSLGYYSLFMGVYCLIYILFVIKKAS